VETIPQEKGGRTISDEVINMKEESHEALAQL